MFRLGLHDGYENWDLVSAIMVHGWAAVKVPEILGETRGDRDRLHPASQSHGAMHQSILHRHAKLVERDASQIVGLAIPHTRWSLTQEASRAEGGRVRKLVAMARNKLQDVLGGG